VNAGDLEGMREVRSDDETNGDDGLFVVLN
jgi:hypothetical protein